MIDLDQRELTDIAFEGGDLADFRVDAEKRTVGGTVVPWGVVASNGYARWKFAADSLHWSMPSRVKLNRFHDRTDLIGRATALDSTGKGLAATFKLGQRAAADEALQDAKDEILDGFSIEIAFDEAAGDSWQPDPADESVRLVTRATLKGTALTGGPAFDDARVESVAASRDQETRKGSKMADKATATAAEQQTGGDGAGAFDMAAYTEDLGGMIVDSVKKLSETLAEELGSSLSEGIQAALEGIHDPQRDGPQPVRASRFRIGREAPVYSMTDGGPSLVRDAWNAVQQNDRDAKDRLLKFQMQTEDMGKVAMSHLRQRLDAQMRQRADAQFAPVTTAVAAAVIPPGYRPDLFVSMLAKGRPFVNAISRGTIDNATAFVVPVFGSFTGATADHVEGVNPTDGSLTFTTKTVTPAPISGLLKLTREIVDASNPAIDAIALGAMRESYSQQTEGKVYALLNGANGQGGTITAGFVPSGAQVRTTTGGSIAAGTFGGVELLRGVRSAMADYPFRRFGAPDIAWLSQEGTSAFATAEDTTGRPLLPSVGATNTAGVGNAVQQGWFVDGLPHIPAWAIINNAAGDADVFTLNSEDAWAWESPLLTFMYFERSGPAFVDVALFAYFATHLLRPVGLSAIRHTRGA